MEYCYSLQLKCNKLGVLFILLVKIVSIYPATNVGPDAFVLLIYYLDI